MTRLRCLGIRHHGPGSARSVRRALDELAPAVVALELPADAQSMLDQMEALRPPVALLCATQPTPGRDPMAVFLPFAEFSPEWQAIQWARERGVPLVAIDLPLAQVLVLGGRSGPSAAAVDPLGVLAEAAGVSDPERWWEDVVEHRGEGLLTFDAIGEAMSAVRGALGADGDASDPWEQRREAHMRKVIRAAAARIDDTLVDEPTVAVVCGAWHVPALRECLDTRPVPSAAHDNATLKGAASVKVGYSWVPWTHRRLTQVGGYGAGVESPGWYQHVFDHPGPDGVEQWFVRMAHLLRSRDLAASPDHLISAIRTARTLAVLRGRPRVGLAEVLDATESVMAEGAALALVMREMVVGERLGEVPLDAVQAPLLRDLTVQQKACRMRPDPERKVIELDLRTDAGRRRSILLHRLVALGVPWGVEEAGRRSTGTFRETWAVRWEPEFAVRLVERSASGTTVESAAAVTLQERSVGADLGQRVELLERALRAELGSTVEILAGSVATASAAVTVVAELMDALLPLARALRYGDVRSTPTEALAAVFEALVARTLAGILPAVRSLGDDDATAMAERLSVTDSALALVGHRSRPNEWAASLRLLAERPDVPGIVQGRAVRLLHDLGTWSGRETSVRLARLLSPGVEPARAAAVVEGLLSGNGSVVVHDLELLAVLDDWLMSIAPDLFVATVPLIRRTFATFEPAERRQIAALAARRSVSATRAASDADWDLAQAAPALATVRAMLGVR